MNKIEKDVRNYVKTFCEKYGLILDVDSCYFYRVMGEIGFSLEFDAAAINNTSSIVNFRLNFEQNGNVDVKTNITNEILGHIKTTRKNIHHDLIAMGQEIHDDLFNESNFEFLSEECEY